MDNTMNDVFDEINTRQIKLINKQIIDNINDNTVDIP